MAIAARSAAIDRPLGRGNRDQTGAQSTRGPRDLVRGFASGRHVDEEAGDLFVTGFAIENPAEDFLRLGFTQMLRCVG